MGPKSEQSKRSRAGEGGREGALSDCDAHFTLAHITGCDAREMQTAWSAEQSG